MQPLSCVEKLVSIGAFFCLFVDGLLFELHILNECNNCQKHLHCSLLELLSKGMQRDDCPYIDKQCKEIITDAVLSRFLVLCYKHKASISYLINLQPQYIQLQILPEKTNGRLYNLLHPLLAYLKI